MDIPFLSEMITGLVSIVGSGGLVTYLNSRSLERKDERLSMNTMMVARIKDLEERDKVCNSRVSDLEKKNWELERQAAKMVDRVAALESGNISAIISADSSMKITKWNAGAVLLFGYLESEMLGVNVDILVPGYLKQQHHDAYERAINDMDTVTSWKNARESTAVHKDGHEFGIMLLITSFKNADGQKLFEARINKLRTHE